MTLKPGTRIELNGTPAMGGCPAVAPEFAKIVQWRVKTNGPRESLPGYHRVQFNDGGRMLIHENGFRVISNQ